MTLEYLLVRVLQTKQIKCMEKEKQREGGWEEEKEKERRERKGERENIKN